MAPEELAVLNPAFVIENHGDIAHIIGPNGRCYAHFERIAAATIVAGMNAAFYVGNLYGPVDPHDRIHKR